SMSGQNSNSAEPSLDFNDTTSVAERTAAGKAYLKAATARIRARHDAGAPGTETVAELSAALDLMLQRLFAAAIATWENAHGKLPSPVSLVALGGYGRAELSPLSDIDLMFLFPSKARASLVQPLQEHLTQEIL